MKARAHSSRDLAGYFNSTERLPAMIFVFDQRVSFVYYLRPDVRRQLHADQIRSVSVEELAAMLRGDSVAEGWVASGPALAWPAIAGREQGLDVVNMGYAGAARGELASAEQIAALDASVISISHGTNCWTRTPHSVDMMRAAVAAFIDVVRQGHPETPIVVVSPVLRPDAETTPNRLGASLSDLRAAMEEAAAERDVVLVPGRDLIGPDELADGIHPDDEGHRILAQVIGAEVAKAAAS